MRRTSVGLSGMIPDRGMRLFNIELKELVRQVSGIIWHFVGRRQRDQGSQRAIIVNVEGAPGNWKLCVVSIDECMQNVAPVSV